MEARIGISRPSARHLRLPLADRDSFTYADSVLSAGKEVCFQDSGIAGFKMMFSYVQLQNGLLAVPSSYWTITAGPKSSASMYSQDSYTNTPPVFSERRVDRRRFGVAFSPSQEGPWRQVLQQAPDTPVFVLNLRSGKLKDDESSINSAFSSSDEESENKTTEIEEKLVRRKTTGTVKLKKMYTTAHSQASRSTKVFGKMLSRISVHPPAHSRPTNIEERPLPVAPELPPQILISLPSPGLAIGLSHDVRDLTDAVPPQQLVVITDSAPRTRSTLPSTWKPKRPPSPLPRPLRKKPVRAQHKRNNPAAPLLHHSPLPPLPPLANPGSPIFTHSPEAIYPDVLSFSAPYPLHNISGVLQPRAMWDGSDEAENSIRMYLKARAMKTATYAIHDGGIISPS